MKRWVVAVAVLLAGVLPVASQGGEDWWNDPLPTDPDTRVGQLPNGLTYYIRSNAFQKGRADFYLVQRVGSILEQSRQRGLAHFLEHMAFNGSRHFPGKEMIHYLETIGVKFGGNLNAYTSVDETVYLIKEVPVERASTVDSCLLVLRDWSDGILLEGEEIDKERGVIEEEWRSRDNYLMRQYAQALPVIYEGSKYADCLPIGDMEVVRRFAYEDLRSYYRRWYRPDLQGVVVVGDFDLDAMERKVREVFGSAEVPDGAPERPYYTVADPIQPVIVRTQDKEAPYVLVSLNWLQTDRPRSYWNTGAGLTEEFLREMTAMMMASRLDEILQAPEPPFSQVDADFGPFFVSQVRSAWSLEAVASDRQCAEALKALLVEQERVHRYGFTEAECQRAKAMMRTSIEHAFAERRKQPNRYYVEQCLDHFTDGMAMVGIEQEQQVFDAVSTVPLELFNDFAKQIDSLPPVLWISGPEGDWMPDKQQIAAWMDSIRQSDVEPYREEVPDTALVDSLPAGGSVVKQSKGALGSTVLTLSNGVRVVVKPTDFKEDEVRLRAFSLGGCSQEDARRDAVTLSLLDDLSELGGLGKYSDVDLHKVLAGRRLSTTLAVGPYSETLTASASVRDLETLFQLIYLQFTDLRRDESAYNSYAGRLAAVLANQDLDPMSEYQDSLVSVIYGNHPLHMRLRSGDMAWLDYDRGLEILRRRFGDASDFTFYVTGRVEVDSLRPLLARYLAVLPAAGVREKVGEVDFREVPGVRNCRYAKAMENPKTVVTITRSGPMDYKVKPIMTLSMLEQILSIVYTETVREEEGGTYGVGVRASLSRLPEGHFDFRIRFTTDSSKVDRLLPLVYDGLRRLADEGPRMQDLQKVREYMAKVYQDRQIDNGYWLDVLQEKDQSGVDRQTRWLKALQSISNDDIRKMARRVLDSPNAKQVIQTGTAR